MRAPIILAASILGACAVGPDYQPPATEQTAEWSAAATATELLTQAEVAVEWWQVFDDPALTRYLEMAAHENQDVQIARSRVREARALRRVADSTLWPQAGVSTQYTRYKVSAASPGFSSQLVAAGLSSREDEVYNANFDASWELDLFGGNRRRAEAANASLGVAEAGQQDVLLSVLAEVAVNYLELRGTQRRLAIAEKNLGLQRETADLTRRKVRVGLSRELDSLRADALLERTSATVPALTAAIRANAYRISVLTGQAPETLLDELLQAEPLPAAPVTVPTGMRAEILRRRPDVRAVERQLAAATATIGVATADLFPKLVLNAGIGSEAASASDLLKGRSETGNLVPFIQWPVFQAGRLKANVEVAKARAEQAAFAYEKAVIGALADAESAITLHAEERNSLEHLNAAANASDAAASIAQRLYDNGLSDFLTVLDAQRQLTEIQDAQIQSETRVLVSLVRLYKSLGGGWQAFAPT